MTMLDLSLQEHWRQELCPLTSGVIFADGRILQLMVEWEDLPGPGNFRFWVRPAGATSLRELRSAGELHWIALIPGPGATDRGRNLRARAGAGALGADGFVALETADNGQLLWVAFFQESNPFDSVQLTATHVEAKSTHRNVWRFPLRAPEEVTVA